MPFIPVYTEGSYFEPKTFILNSILVLRFGKFCTFAVIATLHFERHPSPSGSGGESQTVVLPCHPQPFLDYLIA
jgi:hypothetical protein